MAMSKASRGGRRTSDFGFPSAGSIVGRRSGSPPKPRPSGLFGGDAAYHTANSPPVGHVPSHGDRFAERKKRTAPQSVRERHGATGCWGNYHHGVPRTDPASCQPWQMARDFGQSLAPRKIYAFHAIVR